jgi:hypothetical protein
MKRKKRIDPSKRAGYFVDVTCDLNLNLLLANALLLTSAAVGY